MPALVRPTLFALCLAPLLAAQTERRPESFQVAIGLQQRGLHDEAIRYFDRFLEQHATHALAAEVHYRLAQCHLELQANDAAIAALREALQLGGKAFSFRAEARYRLGNLLQAKGDASGAGEQFAKLVAETDRSHYLAAAARYARGEAQRDLGDDAAAAKSFAAAAELAKGESAGFRFGSLYQLGFAQLRNAAYEPAAQAFEAAVQAAADDIARAECVYLAGDARLRLEQYDRAERSFARAQQLGGDYADDAAYALGWVALGRDDRDGAIEAFGQLIRSYPASPFVDNARLERARCFYQAMQFGNVGAELTPLLKEGHALQREARELQGLCALATGAGKEAVETLQAAVAAAEDADKPRLTFALGEALANLQRWPEALAAYERVPASAGPELFGDALYGACHALHELGEHERSIAKANQLLALEPAHRSQSLARLAIAENQFALRAYEPAQKIYQQLTGDPAHAAIANWKLTWCRYLRGDHQAAAQGFGAIAAQTADANAEEALAMQALALYEAGDRDQALQVADRYRARHQDGQHLARTERIAARVLRQRGDLGAAQRRLARAAAIAAARDDGDAASADVVEQADLAYQQGDFAAAAKLFAEAATRGDAIGARALAGIAWCSFELGDDASCAEALELAKVHANVGEELPGLLELESALHHRAQDWPGAIATATAFLQQYADHEKAPTLRYALGVAYARNGDHAQAQTVLRELLQQGGYPETDRVRYELAWACRRGGDEAAAMKSFRKVAAESQDVELAGESHLYCGTAALAGKQPDLEAARTHLLAVDGSHRKQALYRLGFAEFEAGGKLEGGAKARERQALLGKARDRFLAMVAIDGKELRGEALFLAAECCRRLEDHPAAVKYAARLLAEDADHERAPRARLIVGESALAAGDVGAVIAPLERFLRGHDAGKGDAARADAARANLWLGKARLQRGEHGAAEACFAKVTTLSEGELAAEAQFRIGESRRSRKDLDGAVDAFVRLPILYGHEQWTRRGLLEAGRTYQQLKQPQKAARIFRELVDKHGGSDEAKAAQDQLQDR